MSYLHDMQVEYRALLPVLRAAKVARYRLYPQVSRLRGYGLQSVRDDCGGCLCCLHYPSQHMEDGDEVGGGVADDVDSVGMDTPSPNSMDSSNRNSCSIANRSNMVCSNSRMGRSNRSTNRM